MSKIRLYIDEKLGQGFSIFLNSAQNHYLINVMRVKKHNNVLLFNGKDGLWLGEIDIINNKSIVKLKEAIANQEYEQDLSLYFAPVKSAALDNIVRQATEMGVTSLHPVYTEHTVVRKINIERIKLQLIEAAEQCERLTVPKIFPPISFTELQSINNKYFILCDETGGGQNPHEILKDKKNVALIIGPEGGFSPKELSFAESFCTKMSLGKRILRVDTAIVAALAYVNYYYSF